ncbi:MAG TPA: nucleoside-diphosphate kinase [Candidatus Nanoarchaeia archaeon]|nr:nucleoside-diphosphate kinase [Candidatus Nanoarchaeia archaeon]
MENAVVFVKPEFLDKQIEIFTYFDMQLFMNFGSFDRTLPTSLVRPVPRNLIAEHYSHIKVSHLDVYEEMVRTFSGGGIALRAYRGRDGLILSARRVLGETDPKKAGKDTIRGGFSDDSLELALSEGRAVRNVMHVSGSPEEGITELERFKKFIFSGDKTLYVWYCLR